nr:ATP-binding cassette domain-containing protein [Streptococcus anginosus]
YAYDDTQALDEVSLSVPAGTVTALVGPSGAGKSTLASLIARFDDPDAGTITIGGVDLKSISQDVLYSTVAFVLQDAQLIRDTIHNNIALGAPDATLDQVRQAARAAQIDEFIMSLPDGYDTVLG